MAAAPWQLMGRMRQEADIPLNMVAVAALRRTSAATAAGLDEAEFARRLAELQSLLPDNSSALLGLPPALLGALLADVSGVARRLIEMRRMFPTANISFIVARRPALLLQPAFDGAVVAAAKLASMFPEGGIDELVARQPGLLVTDVDEVVGELERREPLVIHVAWVLCRVH